MDNHHSLSTRTYWLEHDDLRNRVLSAAHWVALDIAADGYPSRQAAQALLQAEHALEVDLGLEQPDLISTTIGTSQIEGSQS